MLTSVNWAVSVGVVTTFHSYSSPIWTTSPETGRHTHAQHRGRSWWADRLLWAADVPNLSSSRCLLTSARRSVSFCPILDRDTTPKDTICWHRSAMRTNNIVYLPSATMHDDTVGAFQRKTCVDRRVKHCSDLCIKMWRSACDWKKSCKVIYKNSDGTRTTRSATSLHTKVELKMQGCF